MTMKLAVVLVVAILTIATVDASCSFSSNGETVVVGWGEWFAGPEMTCKCSSNGEWVNCQNHCEYRNVKYHHGHWLKNAEGKKCRCNSGSWSDCLRSDHCSTSGNDWSTVENGQWAIERGQMCECVRGQWEDCHSPKSCKMGGVWTEHGDWQEDTDIKCQCWDAKWMNCVDKNPWQGPTVEHQIEHTALGRRSKFDDYDFVFDLAGSESASNGAGGEIRPLTVSQLPSLYGEGISLTLIKLGPCAINLPHLHPRATEIIYVLSGSKLRTAFAEENGGRTIVNDLSAGKVTFIPEGLIHYQQNFGCEDAVYLAALNEEDPGVLTVSTRLFTFDDEALSATFDIDVHRVRSLRDSLPAGPADARMECLRRCNKWDW